MKDIQNPAPKKKSCGISKLKVFLLALSYAYLTKAMSGVYSKNMITQLERRFNIPASLAGLIDGSFEIGNLLVIAFVSYFGAKLHRPRIIAVGCIVMCLGCCLTALPHLLMGRYRYERGAFSSTNTSSSMSLCLANVSLSNEPEIMSAECEQEAESLMWVYVLMGNVLRGIGETPIAPLGLSYLDDFAKAENSPFYIGCAHTVEIIGPLIGSFLASFCAQVYVDIGSIDLADVTLALTDARWVGAWWLGYLILGAVNLLAAVPFCFLPKTLPKEGEEDEPEVLHNDMLTRQDDNIAQQNEKGIAKDFLPFLRSLFLNPVYVLFLLVSIMQFNAYAGMMSFMPKYVEQLYGKSASEAIFLIAVYSLPVICIGYFLGGLMMKKFKISTFQAANIAFWTSLVEYIIFFLAFALICENSKVAGITINYEGNQPVSYLDTLYSECNVDCSCPTNIWDPVCGADGVTYVSACLAGCDSSITTGKHLELTNCSCVEASGLPYINASASPGQCQREETCDTMLLYYLIISLICCLIYSFGAMPGYMVLIRSLKPEEKSLGLGIHLLTSRALGGIPSPIFYGAVIDSTCLKWGTTSCGAPGACRIYDSDAFRNIYLGLSALLRAVSYIPCLFILYILKKQSRRDWKTANTNEEKPSATKGLTKELANLDEMQELKGVPED
ncbi:solute carrier organic anion transporter family member 1A2-like isoform X1 [Ambystoma mexicanum]|uniref:solute carrier organic anion transporter family member 1A2-like isoform X1 n=1 Tax=Ambystoma mexicanum TaxID=8296 RepID=UPI0037E78231